MRRVVIYPDAAAVAEATGARLLLTIQDAIAARGVAHVVLTGGTVGVELLRRAAASPLVSLVDWTSVHVWWGDERFVPAGDRDRNELQGQEALLHHLPLPEENIHRMGASTQFATNSAAANAYDALVAEHGDPEWDVALFGMGPDGHVASLFPGHPGFVTESGERRAIAVDDSPKPPPLRVSLTLPAINRAREVWIVAAGAEKAGVVARGLSGDAELPVSAIHGTEATLWLIDAAAATPPRA